MGVIVAYGAAIRDALASNDLSKMKAIEKLAKNTIQKQGDISAVLLELEEAIEKLERKA